CQQHGSWPQRTF
nr:immunoglobulin light chain junction region [Macaca mulatta]